MIYNVDNLIQLNEKENEFLLEIRKIYNEHQTGNLELEKSYNILGDMMKSKLNKYKNIHIYPFETSSSSHGEASRVIFKLRNEKTNQEEFIYYIQKAYELLFNYAFSSKTKKRIYKTVNTPIDIAIHKIPDIEEMINNISMCVLLRGALLPSIILSKEIQEYSTTNYLTPFALFKINRNDNKLERNMEYILNEKMSYFHKEDLNGKDLIFADPMNATAGSLLSIISYLKSNNINYKSIKVFNVITSLKGAIRLSKIKNLQLYSLWVDPVMNEKAYILPGLGDAGDRINGVDEEENARNLIQLIGDYGKTITNLYRNQIKIIEKVVIE